MPSFSRDGTLTRSTLLDFERLLSQTLICWRASAKVRFQSRPVARRKNRQRLLCVGMGRSAPRRPVVQPSADRVAAVGVDGELVVPATSGHPSGQKTAAPMTGLTYSHRPRWMRKQFRLCRVGNPPRGGLSNSNPVFCAVSLQPCSKSISFSTRSAPKQGTPNSAVPPRLRRSLGQH